MEHLKLAITHPQEFRALISYKVWRDPVHDFKKNPKESGWDRERMRDCWGFLDATSRSFAAVIKELKGELSRVICIFYLVLRALDTVEDDMTLKPEVKIPLLLDFYKKLEQPGWNFAESGPNEKDRQLLVEFDKVIAEYQLLNEGCRNVISDICARMGAGMASYIEMGNSPNGLTMETYKDYDLYCHFVAGLVGEGLSGLFVQTDIERPLIGLQLKLSNHMGLFLQKTNIIRDYAEDCEEGRSFWPKECWGTGDIFSHQSEIQRGVVETSPGSGSYQFANTVEGKKAREILSTMLLDAMSHCIKSLDYLALLRDQSVFNFCATPQVMAIATLEKLFDNADVFKKNVKIRKGVAVQLILYATNPREVAKIFLHYAREIHKKLPADDPNYLRWCILLGRIEMWCENLFPSYIMASANKKKGDVRSAMYQDWVLARDRALRLKEHGYKSKEDLDAKAEFERAHHANNMFYVYVFLMIMFTVSVILFVGYLSWMIVWYTIEGRVDPLTLLLLKFFDLLKVHDYKFTLSPFYWMSTFSELFRQAGRQVMDDMEKFHFN
ncbi:bifunctional farnesyl-diphosphate farnesyltransferase/squalene synthase [Malassezia pachydermatis]|uniref:Squalene synthase n=1 Tax=Malassezia pachydermatis TaxID=77020 RepID=A0A0N0RSC7_9BASI|nr:farnesyl-diphosphate farnesyltransferase [Malassezia pachydermatis]KOS14453.1 farnesyl-diphosphate farnesyltransferase [Malassezia pachydermatis]